MYLSESVTRFYKFNFAADKNKAQILREYDAKSKPSDIESK